MSLILSEQEFVAAVRERLERTLEYIKMKEMALDRLPDGHLIVRRNGNIEYYYRVFRRGNEIKRVAIRADTDEGRRLILDLKVRGNLARVLPTAKKNARALKGFLRRYTEFDPRSLIHWQDEGAGDFLYPAGSFDPVSWTAEQPKRNPYRSEDYKYETKRGERVRSKSEMMIADILYDAGIYYRTDCLLRIGGESMYPDFQMLRPRDNALVIWEHFGLTDRSDYVSRAFDKIMKYGNAGFTAGRTLIVTYESEGQPLVRSVIASMLEAYDLVP